MWCFTLSAFLSNEGFSNIFRSSYCWAWVSNVWIWFIFYYCWQTLFKLRVFSLLSSSNYTSADIADDEGSFVFFPQAEFISPLQKTPNQYLLSLYNCCSVKIMLKLLAFKWLLNELLLEIEWSELILIWWFFSIKFIRYFLKFPCLIFPLLISTSLENPFNIPFPFPTTVIINMITLFWFFFCFFSSEMYHLAFSFCPFF